MQLTTQQFITDAIVNAIAFERDAPSGIPERVLEEAQDFQQACYDRVSLVWTGQTLQIHLNQCQMSIDKLEIHPQTSNTTRPFRVHGLGGAWMFLTHDQLFQLLAEWLRFNVNPDRALEWETDTSTFHLKIEVKP